MAAAMRTEVRAQAGSPAAASDASGNALLQATSARTVSASPASAEALASAVPAEAEEASGNLVARLPEQMAAGAETEATADGSTGEDMDLAAMTRDSARSVSVERFERLTAGSAEPFRFDTTPSRTVSTSTSSSDIYLADMAESDGELSLSGSGGTRELGSRINWMLSGDIQQAELRLKPAELGSLNIRVSVQQDQLQVSIAAQTPAARDAIEAALPLLREQLAAGGSQQVSIDVASSAGQGDKAPEQREAGSGQYSDGGHEPSTGQGGGESDVGAGTATGTHVAGANVVIPGARKPLDGFVPGRGSDMAGLLVDTMA